MEKRLLAALIASFLFLFGWSFIAPRLFPGLVQEPTQQEAAVDPAEPEAEAGDPPATTTRSAPALVDEPTTNATPAETAPTGVITASEARVRAVSTPEFRATFSNRGGVISSFRLLEENDLETGEPIELVWQGDSRERPLAFGIESEDSAFELFANTALYVIEESSDGGEKMLRLEAADGSGRRVSKEFVFSDDAAFTYRVEVDGVRAPWGLILGPGMGSTGSANDDRFGLSGNVILRTDGDHEMLKRGKEDEREEWDDVTYAGLVDHYFVKALLPTAPTTAITEPVQLPVFDQEGNEGTIEEMVVVLRARGDVMEGTALYAPKRRDLVKRYGLGEVVDFGIFGPISVLLLNALVWINQYVGNYGWAIVLLTVVIKVCFFPLQHKSMVSMKRMQRVQPKMNAIKDKYRKSKTDPAQRQKMNEEMMKLYKAEGINPASGCLPMLLQLPILWAFYMALSHAIELRGEPWIGWITDLSAKDPYYILPIVMTGTMFLQQLITPTAGDPMQRKIFLAMPLIFGFIFKEFPAGLVLYWMVQNILTIVQQAFLNNWWKNHPESLESSKGSKPPKKAVVI